MHTSPWRRHRSAVRTPRFPHQDRSHDHGPPRAVVGHIFNEDRIVRVRYQLAHVKAQEDGANDRTTNV